MKRAATPLLLVLILLSSCKNKNIPPYSRLEKLSEPIVFLNAQITSQNGICFSEDGSTLYTSNPIEEDFTSSKSKMGIYESVYKDGNWSSSELINLDGLDAYHPVLSNDGSKLFFNSRSHPDTLEKAIPHNIWFVSKSKEGWTNPQLVSGVNSDGYDSYPSLARNNNLYFNSNRDGGEGGMDFYVSYFENGSYQDPIPLLALNSVHEENDLAVDPEERFIIFNRYIHATKSIDLFISYNKNGAWSDPKALININKDNQWELTPTISPDGNYFFYEVEGRIMQIDLDIIVQIDE